MPQRLGLVVTTLGRLPALERLLDSLVGELGPVDELVIVAQRNAEDVRALASRFAADGMPVTVTTSERGASRGRNVGVATLSNPDALLVFPNDTTFFPPGVVGRLRDFPDGVRAGGMTVADEFGAKLELPAPGTPLDRWNVWSVIEMGILMRRSLFDELGGFDETIGTGALTPWQSGEATDLLLRLVGTEHGDRFEWMPSHVALGGIADAAGLSPSERRRKLRGYGRGYGLVVTRWRYPLLWRLAATAGGLLFAQRNRGRHYAWFDGWWVFLGRLEGMLGRTLGSGAAPAVTR